MKYPLLSMCICSSITACAPVNVGPDRIYGDFDRVEVISVQAADYTAETTDPAMERACRQWRLNPAQVTSFFQLATRYDTPPYRGFYNLPCVINGELKTKEHTWSFSIGAAATAVWRSGKESVYWGCSADACATLVLLPADGFDTD